MPREDYIPNKTVLQSYVHHEKGVIFVSTIERSYDTYQGETRGLETMVWEWDEEKRERKPGFIGHMGGIDDHIRICRCWISEGEMLDPEKSGHQSFMKSL